jgi:DNA-binding transcriptional LysR family regulator
VTAAAARLGYTPSAVSQQVGALEKEAGTALLERVGRGVRPTAAGLLLTGYADAIGRQVAEAETALADLVAGRTGRLTVRYFATAGAALVAPAVARLRAEHPGVQLELKLTDPEDPLPEVKEGRADVALVVGASGASGGPRGRTAREAARRPVSRRTAQGASAGRAAERGAGELAEEPWVGSEWPGPCLDAQLDACEAAGFRPRFAVESEDYVTAQGFVAAGLGVTLIPRLGLGSRHPDVVVRVVRDPEPVRTIHAAVRETAPPQPALRAFLRALRDAANEGCGRRLGLGSAPKGRGAVSICGSAAWARPATTARHPTATTHCGPGGAARSRRSAHAFVGSQAPPAPRTATVLGKAYGNAPYQRRETVKPKVRQSMPPTASSQKWLAVETMTRRVSRRVEEAQDADPGEFRQGEDRQAAPQGPADVHGRHRGVLVRHVFQVAGRHRTPGLVDHDRVDEVAAVHEAGRGQREEVVADQGHGRRREEDEAGRRVPARMTAVQPHQDTQRDHEVQCGVVVVHADDQPSHRVHGVVDRLLDGDAEMVLDAPDPVGVAQCLAPLFRNRVADL